jgi:meso-butanediol dehydrogenase/(S,S)-butanediol dehydrogenase/diacetyl reductase
MLLSDKVAIVTGAGRGIGRAIALQFAREGAAVAIAARTKPEIAAVETEIRGAGGRAAAITADVSDHTQCQHLVRACEAAFGRVDIVVNNAGEYGPVKPVEEITPAEWDRVLGANLRSAYLMTHLVLPGMYARGCGVILNISSVSAKAAFAWGAAYAASKAGLLGLTRVTAVEAARKGVRVNAICPGPVTETKISQDLLASLAQRRGVTPEQQLQGVLGGIPQGRPQTVQEIAAAALFLCSDAASAITGQSLNVGGGMAFY